MYPDISENVYLFTCFRKTLRPHNERFQNNLRPHGYRGITNKKTMFVKLTVQKKADDVIVFEKIPFRRSHDN